MSSPSREGCGIVGEAPTPGTGLSTLQPFLQSQLPTGHTVDQVEARLVEWGAALCGLGETPPECPLIHRFTPGLYVREIFNPAGAIIVTKKHRTEHPFVVSKGRVMVYTDGEGWREVRAPHCGITKPGTRRVIVALEDTIWMTFHPTTLTDPIEIEKEIIEPYTNPLLGVAQ